MSCAPARKSPIPPSHRAKAKKFWTRAPNRDRAKETRLRTVCAARSQTLVTLGWGRRLDMSINVEILIRGNMDDLWQKTQEPKLRGRWDLRFSQIDYLPSCGRRGS